MQHQVHGADCMQHQIICLGATHLAALAGVVHHAVALVLLYVCDTECIALIVCSTKSLSLCGGGAPTNIFHSQ
jgi:hypothetical protein